MALTPDGRRAITAGLDRILRVWDLDASTHRDLPRHNDSVWAVALTPDGRCAISGGEDRILRVWDLEVGTHRELPGHNDSVYAVALTPDGRRAISAGKDRILRVWDLEKGGLVAVHPARAAVHALSVHGARIVMGGAMTGDRAVFDVLDMVNFPSADVPWWFTPRRLWLFEEHSRASEWTASCPRCGVDFAVPPTVLAAAQSGTRDYDFPALLCACPQCQGPLRSTPFVAHAWDDPPATKRKPSRKR